MLIRSLDGQGLYRIEAYIQKRELPLVEKPGIWTCFGTSISSCTCQAYQVRALGVSFLVESVSSDSDLESESKLGSELDSANLELSDASSSKSYAKGIASSS